jgi:putative methionine-R-sulfoxide reductase with GAF domain
MNHEANDPQQDAIEARKRLMERPSRARYEKVRAELDKKWRRRELRSDRMMREVVDALWDVFAGAPYSWVGFYLLSPDGSQLVLGPHREKPACSPIPLTGVCGKALQTGASQNVPDVKALGAAHIECDPKNLSEIAVPVFDKNGKAYAVLDVDSEQKAAFDEMDQRWLERLVKPFQDVDNKF